jgi:hypothetical protein
VKLTLPTTTILPPLFDYCATRFDDGVKYSVMHNGTHALNGGKRGVLVGDVARYYDNPREWWATPDSGDAVALRWYGPFTSRVDASRFLLGAKVERDRPALATFRGESIPVNDAYKGRIRG